MRDVMKESGMGRWLQDVAALASVALMGWTVLMWGQIAQVVALG